MNINQFTTAQVLTKQAAVLQTQLNNLDADYKNTYSMPPDQFSEHKQSVREWLQSELDRVNNEFAAL